MNNSLASSKIFDLKSVKKAWAPAIPTVIFDTYWRFAVERQAIFFRRLKEQCGPWTDDPILSEYKFTNAYRAADRVSQYLISNVIYNGDPDPKEVFYRIILFKLFNKIETWELLENKIGKLTYSNYDFNRIDKIFNNAMNNKKTIYSAAYIMPSGNTSFGFSKKHRNHLKLLEKMMEDKLYIKLSQTPSMSNAYDILRSYPTIGDFLAYQLVTDINYSELTNFSEMEFVVPGPGAKSGLKKCFKSFGGISEAELILRVTQRQSDEFKRLGLEFKNLGGRPLQLIDCQNLFCEIDKYSRIAHPEANGSGRTRIKQKFKPIAKKIQYNFPPKWKVSI